jgi:hypothetical protein
MAGVAKSNWFVSHIYKKLLKILSFLGHILADQKHPKYRKITKFKYYSLGRRLATPDLRL